MSAIDWTTIEAAIHSWVRLGADLSADRVIWDYEGGKRPPAPYVEMSIADVVGIAHDWKTYEPNPLVFADITVTADAGTDNFTAVAHGRLTGTGPVRLTTTGTTPGGTAVATDYWVIKTGDDTFKLATTFTRSMTALPIDLTSAGTGTIKLVDTPETELQGEELTVKARGHRTATLVLQAFGATGIGEGAVPILVDVEAALALHEYALDLAGVGIGNSGAVLLIEGRRGGILEPRARCEIQLHLASELEARETYIERVQVTITETPHGANLELWTPSPPA